MGSEAGQLAPEAEKAQGQDAGSLIEEYEQLVRSRIAHLVEVREPLVLISQMQRSGGTLLSRLFDGHPQCHAHPYELKFRGKNRWPQLDLDAPDTWFEQVYEPKIEQQFVEGYKKPGLKTADIDVLPFLIPPSVVRAIFEATLASRSVRTARDVLDCYFTSYFNAWLDNQNLYSGPKRVITAFSPRTIMQRGAIDRFFADYPDGFIVSIVREPRTWYASAVRHRPKYEDTDRAMRRWRQAVTAAIEGQRAHGDRVIVITFEALVRDAETTMTRIARRLGIEMSPVLLAPTFNGRAVRPNSSDRVDSYGVVAERATAYRHVLDDEKVARVDELAGDLYEHAAGLAAETIG